VTPPGSARLLPDVAFEAALAARPLDRVGMANIALPIRIHSDTGDMQVAASVDVAVDLADADARGIHMSRLYLQLQQAFAAAPLHVRGLRATLANMIESQAGLSTTAVLSIRYDHLLLRPALASAHAGWKRYPVVIDASLDPQGLRISLRVAIDYSSTCPASAALSRQLNADRFVQDFGGSTPLSTAAIGEWLASTRGMAATPHAQRSRADISIELDVEDPAPWPLVHWIDAIESALGTPVQTAVKREDEQAFARLNAEHLMFCEDAARRIAGCLAGESRVRRFSAEVTHLESLHAHDAVARVSGPGGSRR